MDGGRTVNYGRYSNPALDALITRAVSEPDDVAREALLREAVGAAMADVALIPLHIQKNIWATGMPRTMKVRLERSINPHEGFYG